MQVCFILCFFLFLNQKVSTTGKLEKMSTLLLGLLIRLKTSHWPPTSRRSGCHQKEIEPRSERQGHKKSHFTEASSEWHTAWKLCTGRHGSKGENESRWTLTSYEGSIKLRGGPRSLSARFSSGGTDLLIYAGWSSLLMFLKPSITRTHVIVAVGKIQRRFVLHVPQHGVGARLAEEVGDGGVLSPHCQMQRRAAVKHGGVHVGSPAEQQLHGRHVVQLGGEMKGCFSARTFLRDA